MICPFCKTENRDERASCYNCNADLTALRSVVLRSRHLYNDALEHTERGRNEEAISQLRTAVELDASFVNAWVVMGTIYAKMNRFEDAKTAWRKALALDSRFEKCHDYLAKVEQVSGMLPAVRNLRKLAGALGLGCVLLAILLIVALMPVSFLNFIRSGESGSGWAILLLAFPILVGGLFWVYEKIPAILRYLSGVFREK